MFEENSVGRILYRWRQEKRERRIEAAQWTQAKVAKRLGVSRATYIAWEQDSWLPERSRLKRIVELFRPSEAEREALYLAAGLPPDDDRDEAMRYFFHSVHVSHWASREGRSEEKRSKRRQQDQ